MIWGTGALTRFAQNHGFRTVDPLKHGVYFLAKWLTRKKPRSSDRGPVNGFTGKRQLKLFSLTFHSARIAFKLLSSARSQSRCSTINLQSFGNQGPCPCPYRPNS